MEKLQYLVWLPEGTPRNAVKPLMIDEVAPKLLATGILGLTIDLDDDDADVAPPVPPPAGEHDASGARIGLGRLLRPAGPDREGPPGRLRPESTDTRCSSPSTPTTAGSGGPAPTTGPTAGVHRGS